MFVLPHSGQAFILTLFISFISNLKIWYKTLFTSPFWNSAFSFLIDAPIKIVNFLKNKITKMNQSLNHWEQIQKFKIIDQVISIETGEITPSMKLKRNIIEQKFANIIDSFYK